MTRAGRYAVANVQELVLLADRKGTPTAVTLMGSLDIPPHQRQTLEVKLNNYLRSCGCAEGTFGLLFGMVLAGLYFMLSTHLWTLYHYMAALSFPLAALAVGKVSRRQFDVFRFRRECRNLAARLKSKE